ncbi:hypothetical protein Dimus_023599 [Dionaea muscipula]
MKSDRKPPLARSPMRVQARRSLRSSTATPIRTLSGRPSKVQTPNPGAKELRPEYGTISSELTALAKLVEKEFGTPSTVPENGRFGNLLGVDNNKTISLFERGRFYDEYSARRNERLKRKMEGETGGAAAAAETTKTVSSKLGVKIEYSAKKRVENRKMESLVKSVSAAYEVDRSEHPRYALRSINKPPLPALPVNIERSAVAERKTRLQHN